MRRGFSLIELVLVLAVSGLLFGIALPRLSAAVDQIEVGAAANHLLAAHRRARTLSIIRGQVLVLTVDAGGLVIRARGTSDSVWAEDGPSSARVILEGAPRQFTFLPEGLTMGLSNATLRFTRGAAVRTIVISRLGRLRVVR